MEATTVAQVVRDFYSRHPYPPPVKSLERYQEKWSNPERRRIDFHLQEPDRRYRENRKTLIAGCGTAQAAKYAMRWPDSEVLGIDVSPTSIQETARLRDTYNLSNLQLCEIPIERASELNERFDHIVCTGVLHHLPDPDAGLCALRDVLTEEGSMQIMVYAPYGRAGIYLIQDYCRRLGIGTTLEEIDDLAASMGRLPPNHPLIPVLRAVPDKDQAAALADALLNPNDRPYSVDEFLAFVHSADLEFGRWVRQAEYSPHCGSLRGSPHSKLLTKLTETEAAGAVELYRGTMLRHSAIVYRSDRSGRAQPVNFEGNNWLGYVPIRYPDNVIVRDRLPPDAAAVLINPNHSQTDIFLPISRKQLKFFEGIDGKQSIGEIVGPSRAKPETRSFFETLWRHDQIVIDASQIEP